MSALFAILLPATIWVLFMLAISVSYLTRPTRRVPRPDYVRIAQLERELGIGQE